MKKVTCYDLPKNPDLDTIYHLKPKNPNDEYYKERTDRNIGWITKEEQEMLKTMTVGIAGCGGMGGSLNERLLRLGIGHIKIADPELFDVSNINRQLGATRSTVGENKAIQTARNLRKITDDSSITVFPQGIRADVIKEFVFGCDIICDEIEFYELSTPITLHREARKKKIPILGCNTAGFGAHLFLFTSSGMPREELFGMTLQEAEKLDGVRRSGLLPTINHKNLIEMLISRVAPEAQEYCINNDYQNLNVCRERLLKEGVAPIITTNPAFATGLVANWILLYLLRNSDIKRDVAQLPEMPGYFYIDSAKMITKIVTKKWW